MGDPPDLVFDFGDELADLRRGDFRLPLLDAPAHCGVVTNGKPELNEIVGDQGEADDRHEKRDVFQEQPAANFALSGSLLPGGGLALQEIHSITSSARESVMRGSVRPSDFAVLRLMTNSNLVGRKTGRSAGFSPLRIRPV